MKLSNIIMTSAAVLLLGIGGLHWFDRLNAGPPATAPAAQSAEHAAEEISTPAPADDSAALAQSDAPAMSASSQQQVAQIERALVAADPQLRDTAFNSLLPGLLQEDPGSVVDMLARLAPGEPRDTLRDEVTRQWIRQDPDAAVEWIDTLWDAEKKASALTAMRTLAASSPAQAIAVADRFGVGRDDGSLQHLVQIWAAEKPDEAMQWLATQPDSPQTEQLRARIEQARAPPP
jgi:hypothetical protein